MATELGDQNSIVFMCGISLFNAMKKGGMK